MYIINSCANSETTQKINNNNIEGNKTMADVIMFSSSFSCPSSLNSYQPIFGRNPCLSLCKRLVSGSECCTVAFKSRKQSAHFKVRAGLTEREQPKWWERNAGAANMIDIHSSEEFSNALSEAGDRLVIVEFYGTWCASCRAMFPKLCRTAEEHPEILFLKVNFDENKAMCKKLNVRVLPYFHLYHGANGQLESFSCSLAKFQKIRDGIQLHKTCRPKDVLAGSSN